MKRLLVVALVFLAGVAAAGGFGMVVPAGTSVKVAPERGTVYATPWVSGMAVVQGQLVQREQAVYMAEVASPSSTTVPEADANFRKLLGNKPRDVLVLCNTGTSALWLGIGEPAEVGKGIKLLEETTIAVSGINAAVYATAAGSGGYVAGTDITK